MLIGVLGAGHGNGCDVSAENEPSSGSERRTYMKCRHCQFSNFTCFLKCRNQSLCGALRLRTFTMPPLLKLLSTCFNLHNPNCVARGLRITRSNFRKGTLREKQRPVVLHRKRTVAALRAFHVAPVRAAVSKTAFRHAG